MSAPLVALTVAAAFAAVAPNPEGARPRFETGVSLGLFSRDPHWDYTPLVAEIAALDASDVALVVRYAQPSGHSTSIGALAGLTAERETLVRTATAIREAGMRVRLFPMIVIAGSDLRARRWRGRIAPADLDLWWRSYTALALQWAELATEIDAAALIIGSELISMERHTDRWRDLISAVRPRFDGALIYSANWDHYQPIEFWPDLDAIGISTYFPLYEAGASVTNDVLESRWRYVLGNLARFGAEIGRPVVLTEVGCPSRSGAGARPWRIDTGAAVDLDEQFRYYESFLRVAAPAAGIRGYYIWNWFGFGGGDDGDYTPRGKPAAQTLRAAFRRQRELTE